MIKPLANEKEILLGLKNGDMASFELLYKHFHKPLWYFAREILKDADEAEDTVQQVFLTIWERRNEWVLSGPVKSYLFTAVKNTCLKKLDKAGKTMHADWENENEHQQAHQKTETPLQEKELKKAIETALNRLPEKCRLVFTMSRFGELTYQEIANELGISIKTVENQIGKALGMMRESLKYHFLWWPLALGMVLKNIFEGIGV